MVASVGTEEEKGIIGRVYEKGFPVIYKFVNELPAERIRSQLRWLTVISWKYNGSSNNGMPLEAENREMIVLEDTIEDRIERAGFLQHAYSRTGNNLKELVYYIHDQEQFLEAFNQALNNHPRYPIEIKFYQDKEWEDFQGLLNEFSNATNNSIWTLPTSSEDSFFDPVVSAVAFVYPAFTGHCPGHSVVRAAGAKRSSDHKDHHCYRPCSAAGLACSDSLASHHNH